MYLYQQADAVSTQGNIPDCVKHYCKLLKHAMQGANVDFPFLKVKFEVGERNFFGA